MNPHCKFKNNGPDGFMLVLLMLSLCFIVFIAIVLNPLHKKNIEKPLKPLSQQYALKQSDQILFCKPDEMGWTRGQVLYLWGYYPVIFSQDLNKIFEFKDVEWMVGNE